METKKQNNPKKLQKINVVNPETNKAVTMGCGCGCNCIAWSSENQGFFVYMTDMQKVMS